MVSIQIKRTIDFICSFSYKVQRKILQFLTLNRLRYASLGENVVISRKSYVSHPSSVHLGTNVVISDYSALVTNESLIEIGCNSAIMEFARVHAVLGNVVIGENCSLQQFSMISGFTEGVRIGNGVRIGAHTLLIGSNHDFGSKDLPIWQQGSTSKGIIIHNDVWIGSNATILDGVEIGMGSIIGAGSVVTKNIPPYSIAVGVPARVIRYR